MSGATVPAALLRFVATVLALGAVPFWAKRGSPYFLVLLVCVLTLSDGVDALFFERTSDTARGSTKTFEYQVLDKINDVLAYSLVYCMTGYDAVFYLTAYRAVGVLLFALTKKSIWLIIFFDFVKEYLLYRAVLGTNYAFILPAVLAKIGFEIFLHTKVNKADYNTV